MVTLTLYDSWGDGWGWSGLYNSVTIDGVDYTTDLAIESFALKDNDLIFDNKI